MTMPLNEKRESEASRVAKLKGWRSIGFGRWVDRSGNLVAYTNKRGRLVNYETPPPKASKAGGVFSDKNGSDKSFIRPFVKGKQSSPVSKMSPNERKKFLGYSRVTTDQRIDEYDKFSSKYSAEAFLVLLKWIDNGDLTKEELKFFTHPAYIAYMPIMKDAVYSLDLALIDYKDRHQKINKDVDVLNIELSDLAEECDLSPEITHVMMMDMYYHGPSYIYANVMDFDYAVQADSYQPTSKILDFDYSKVTIVDTADGE